MVKRFKSSTQKELKESSIFKGNEIKIKEEEI